MGTPPQDALSKALPSDEPSEADITRGELEDAITLIWVAHRLIFTAADETTPCMQEVMDDLEKAANHLQQELHDIAHEPDPERVH